MFFVDISNNLFVQAAAGLSVPVAQAMPDDFGGITAITDATPHALVVLVMAAHLNDLQPPVTLACHVDWLSHQASPTRAPYTCVPTFHSTITV